MLDLQRTWELYRGGLLEPDSTWTAYRTELPPWQRTAWLLTGPLIIAATLAGAVLGPLFHSMAYWGLGGGGLGGWVRYVVVFVLYSAAGLALFAAIIGFLSGMFGGRRDFNAAFAAVSFMAVASLTGNVLSHLPWIGWLLGLGMTIYALVLLYRAIPVFLEVPGDKRVLHFILSLVAGVAVMVVLATLLGGASGMPGGMSGTEMRGGRPSLPLGLERQAWLMEQTEGHTYEPPDDGRLSEAQVTRFLAIAGRAGELRRERLKALEAFKDDAAGEEPGLGQLMRGMQGAMGAYTAEMEAVVERDGNWAEYQWIRQQLIEASVRREGDAALRHNRELYEANKERLRAALSYE